MEPTPSLLPASDPQRELLHNEVHARPPARIHLPALLTYVAVFNEGVDREQECALLRRLPGQAALTVDDLHGNFLRLRLPGYTLKWERHTEFTRYSIVQPLPEGCGLGAREPDLLTPLATPPGWLAGIPGRTFAAIQLVMVEEPIHPPAAALAQARTWFGEHTVVASLMGNNAHSLAVTDFWLRPCGFERMLAVCPPGTSETRAGRIAARLFELETYRLMALRAGQVAAAVSYQPLAGPMAAAGFRSVFDSRQIPGQVLDVLAVRHDVLLARPAAVDAMLQAWQGGLALLQLDPAGAAESLSVGTDLDPAQYRAVMGGLQFFAPDESLAALSDPTGPVLQGGREVARLMRGLGLLRSEPDWARMIDTGPARRVLTGDRG